MDSRSQHDAAPTLGSPFEGELSRRPCATEGVSFQMYSVGLMGSFATLRMSARGTGSRTFNGILRYAQDERAGAWAPVLIPSVARGSRRPNGLRLRADTLHPARP